MLTAKLQYAVILLHEVQQNTFGRPLKLKNIADKFQLDAKFLAQVARVLRIKGYLRAVRGPGGGYVANADLAELNLTELMQAVEAKTLKQAVPSPEGALLTNNVYNKAVEKLKSVLVLE